MRFVVIVQQHVGAAGLVGVCHRADRGSDAAALSGQCSGFQETVVTRAGLTAAGELENITRGL